MALACLATPSLVRGDDFHVAAAALHEPVTVAADSCAHWQEGAYDVWHLRGNCYVNQGLTYARGGEAIVWVDAREFPQRPMRVIVYMEAAGQPSVTVDYGGAPTGTAQQATLGKQSLPHWFQRLETANPLKWRLPTAAGEPAERPAIYARGMEQFNPDRRRQLLLAQYNEFGPIAPGVQALPPGVRRIQVLPRYETPNEVSWRDVGGGQKAAVVSGGIRVLIDGLPSAGLPAGFGPLGVVDISTDRAVIWASGVDAGAGGEGLQSQDAPLEIYMEGNIEFRQGDRIVFADRMFYDVRRQVGVILNAELLTQLPAIDGRDPQIPLRLKADV
ncbi:MAG TPA: hypothetical protein PKC18_21245, partial [Lacipirellulaceae bacterium]|nr:hypothetical protein [Lacipirellulaceae bacterium]